MDAVCETPDFCATVLLGTCAARAERQLAALAAHEQTVRAFVCHDADAVRRQLVGPLGADRTLVETAQWFHERVADWR
jgi:hypothetical protein